MSNAARCCQAAVPAADVRVPCRRGALLAGAVFGLLHIPGRNWQTASWAALLGTLYGCSFVYTYDLSVPVVAHSLGNVAAAWFWLQARDKQSQLDTYDS